MIIKAQFLIPIIIALNILGIGLSLLYGKYGGTGGETTEGVFLGIRITGTVVALITIIFSVIFKDWFLRNWYFVLPLIFFGVLQAIFLELIK